MAYVNVAEWKTEQVCEWLKGLDNSVLPYVHSFTNHAVNGQQLLSLRPEDLEHLGVLKLGHQEIILEAVEYLRNFHYELDRENLQLLALRLSCQAHSLQNELFRQTDSKPVTTQTLSDVASVIMAVKPLIRWLDRPPFSGQLEYNEKKVELMKLALEMATCAQRDRFAEKPIEEIRTTCGQLAKLADYIIQDISDPMILQPASLDLATLKKRPGDDLGFYILPSFHGAHQIAEIKFGSAAHQCGKMEEGDEIVQVNYQTVVGWERKNLLELFRESPAEVLLTLKRRPRHTKVYGQIYIKPYRLPSNKKTSYTTRWQHNLPSPRPELLTIPDFTMPLPRPKNSRPEPTSILDTVNILDTMIIDSSDSDSETEPPLSIRLYSTKPRNSVQRRATITGASPTTKHGIDIEQFWKELKQEHNTSSQLRDKAASCAHGLDNVPSTIRSQTCINIEQSKRKKKNDGQNDDKKIQFQDKSMKHDVSQEKLEFIDDTSDNELKTNLDSTYLEYNDKQGKETKFICDKYEPTIEKSIYTNSTMEYYNNTECYSQNMDSPDGSCSSKQFLDHKSKVFEKEKSFEKGVVNKAMMVARSIGLHGSLNKSSSNSPRSNRKRSILFARKRNISVKDIGIGDLEGWLTYRTRGAGGAWAKAWFVLKCSSLYRFKARNSIKADCLIALTGFTVSRAVEVKSRKYAFKVYHTGTVFYFAADTEDFLALWVDAINKATLGADGHSRNSALFSETDESDCEQKSKIKNVHTMEYKSNFEKPFGSLKKVVRKDCSVYKDHEINGASLDRKYLKFLGTKNHNVPVPTAQFRSYRRVLPTSMPNKKQDSVPNSPDLQMTIAGSTFYGLYASHSTTDISNNIQDMNDYRRTTDRCLNNKNRRPEDVQGIITLEEFMLLPQEDQRQVARTRVASPRMTPLTNDHVHIQHRNFHDNETINEQSKIVADGDFNNDVHTRNKNNDEVMMNTVLYDYSRNMDNIHTMRQFSGDLDSKKREYKELSKPVHKKSNELCYIDKKKLSDGLNFQQMKSCNSIHCKTITDERQITSLSHNKPDTIDRSKRQVSLTCEYNTNIYINQAQSSSNHDISRSYDYYLPKNINNLSEDVKPISRSLTQNNDSSESNNDFTFHAFYQTLQRGKKNVSVSRKGSFNLTIRRDHISSDKHWLDSIRRVDKKNINYDKIRLKNVAQYQPPPIPTSPFEQEGMTAAFEMHLDKNEQVQKTNRLKNLFSNKYQQKSSTLDLPKETQKTLLGSPKLHRALFREKCYNQSSQSTNHSNNQNPNDSGFNQLINPFNGNNSQTLSQSFSSVSSVNDWSSDTSSLCTANLISKDNATQSFQKEYIGRNSLIPPTLPYIPPPTSPPPDYPGLEYPPVFEPGTYSLLDASLLRNRNKSNQNIH
ncbi:hypothetical protein HZU73_03536 [Apis mellifera caucasica]|nr:hypothetical protein HZU73_03536 [Apis mellifera caucasica]